MPILPAYDGLLTKEEAVEYLKELMGRFAPPVATFETRVKPSWRRKHPGSPEALHLEPAALNIAGSHLSGWTREQLRAYAEARATHAKDTT